MSDDWLTIVPTDPNHVPSADRGRAAVAAIAALAPEAEGVSIAASDAPEFVDAGSNFATVACPRCDVAIDDGWWRDRMSDAAASNFEDLRVVLPCCGTPGDLNDLVYDWPQGFARWRLEVFNPGRGLLEPPEVESLRGAVGHDIRVIWTHV